MFLIKYILACFELKYFEYTRFINDLESMSFEFRNELWASMFELSLSKEFKFEQCFFKHDIYEYWVCESIFVNNCLRKTRFVTWLMHATLIELKFCKRLINIF